jgi:hypothetical protein
MVSVMIGCAALRAVMMLFEIEQFASDLDAGQVEKVPNRFHLDARQGTVEANKGILKNIICRLPSPEPRKSPEHPPGEFQEPIASVVQKKSSRPLIAGFGEVYQPLKLGIGTDGHMDAFLRGGWL